MFSPILLAVAATTLVLALATDEEPQSLEKKVEKVRNGWRNGWSW
jgi:hypothetical protein